MRADATVVADGDLAAVVGVELVGYALVGLLVGEPDAHMRVVAERLGPRSLASAQARGFTDLDGLTPRVTLLAVDQVRRRVT